MSSWVVHAGSVFVADIHPSRSFESVRWNTCVRRLDFGLYSHPKEFLRNGVRTHVNSKGKIPSTGKILPRGVSNPRPYIAQDNEPNTLPRSNSGPSTNKQTSSPSSFLPPTTPSSSIPVEPRMCAKEGCDMVYFKKSLTHSTDYICLQSSLSGSPPRGWALNWLFVVR